jgi:transcription antitermination factor NusG
MLGNPTDGVRRNLVSCSLFVEPADETPAAAKRRIAPVQFTPGRLVRICRGAFVGVEGVVLRDHGSSRLIIAPAISQSGVHLEIDAEMLEATD